MIWRALKSGEELGFDSKIHIGKNTMSYSALDIQNSILQKFSCDGPVPNNPMIAISRSPYGNTFKLRTQDTAIIYSADHGIFTPSEKSDYGQSKVKSWMNTLVYQTEFDGSSNSSWGDLSQAALAVIMLANSRRTKSDSMKRKYESAISALLQSSSPNGLLTGQLNKDEELVIPKTFSEHHSYWLGTFEMPYILWIYGEDSLHTNRPISEDSSTAETALYTTQREPILNLESYDLLSQLLNQKNHQAKYANEEKVAEYPDEWLYSKPRFLTFQVDLREKAMQEFYRQNQSRDLGTVINNAFFETIKWASHGYINPKSSSEKMIKGYIINVPETIGTSTMEDFPPQYIYTTLNLRLHIDPRVRSERGSYTQKQPAALPIANHSPPPSLKTITNDVDLLPTSIKKRLMHFIQMDFELAMTCYHAFPEAEDLSLFFDRHATHDKYFSEDVQFYVNKWTTELHLSFFQVLSDDLVMYNGISHPRRIQFPKFRKSDKPPSIGRVSMSVRLDGDFFDSSWICHFIEYNPQKMSEWDRIKPITEIKIGGEIVKAFWQERRILELLIINKMLDKILLSSKTYFQKVKQSISNTSKKGGIYNKNQQQNVFDNDTSTLLVEFGIFDNISTDVFVSMNSVWSRFQHITDIVEEDLKENILTIALWMSREPKRHDKPQWSKNNELEHAPTISQLLAISSRKFDELQRCYDSIKVFNALLAKRMEAARVEWEIQSSNDIRLFTYVTVVFLPISFATGLFSMSAAPSENILRHMIIVAAVALGATIIALFNAKALDSKLVRPVFKVCRYILEGFFFLLYHSVLSCVSLLYHIMILPCVYLVARYLYYPIFSREKSAEPSTNEPVAPMQKPEDPQAKKSVTTEEAVTESFSFAKLVEKSSELFHKFDNPTSLALENFEKTKRQREKTKQSTSSV